MNLFYIIGIVIFLLLIVVSRFLNERAIRTLNSEEKVKLIDSFSNMRKYNLIPIIVLIGLFFFLTSYFPEFYLTIIISYFGLLIIFVIITSLRTFKKLHKLELPAIYIKRYIVSMIVQYFGLSILFTSIILSLLN
jgi:hypothetical protein